MKRTSFFITVVVLVLLALIVSASISAAKESRTQSLQSPQAQVGTTFTYQSQLKTASGPVTGLCDLAFRLYDDVSVGNQVGSAITSTVPITHGLFTTQLDFGVSAFTGDARWLQIAVRCPSGSGSFATLSPRQALTAAPYALALPGLYTQQNAFSPNVIGGYSGNFISSTVVGSVIAGGGSASSGLNRVTGSYGVVGGGANNTATDWSATVSGGTSNTANGTYATVGGGSSNTASGYAATIGGGSVNNANGYAATIGGGDGNFASGNGAFIGGGGYNGTFIAGNWAIGNASTVCGDMPTMRAARMPRSQAG